MSITRLLVSLQYFTVYQRIPPIISGFSHRHGECQWPSPGHLLKRKRSWSSKPERRYNRCAATLCHVYNLYSRSRARRLARPAPAVHARLRKAGLFGEVRASLEIEPDQRFLPDDPRRMPGGERHEITRANFGFRPIVHLEAHVP